MKTHRILLVCALLACPALVPEVHAGATGDFASDGGAVFDGGDWGDTGYGVAVDTFSAGGPYIYVAGAVYNSGQDYLLLQYGPYGNLITSATINYAGNYDEARAVAVDPAGSVIVTGFVTDAGGTENIYTVKYSSDLASMLATSTPLDFGGNARAFAVKTDGSGNVYVAGKAPGATGDDILLVKYDTNLTFISSASYTFSNSDAGAGIAVDSTGDVFVAGSLGNERLVVLKFSPNLLLTGSVEYYSPGYVYEGRGIAIDQADNVIVSGVARTTGSDDCFAVKYNNELSTMLSSSTYDAGGSDSANGVTVDGSGNVIIAGYGGTVLRYCTLKLGPELEYLSSETYLTDGSDQAFAIAAGTGTNVYVTGRSQGDIRTIRYDTAQFSADSVPPATVTDLSVELSLSGGGGGATAMTSAQLSWTMPGDDGTAGALEMGSEFLIQYSTSPSGPWNADYAMSYSTSGVAPGTRVSQTVWGLMANTRYYFKLWHRDDQGNLSAYSANECTLFAQLVAGAPARVTFENWGLAVLSGQPSSAVKIKLIDNNWITTRATSTITVQLSGRRQAYDPVTYMTEYSSDPTALFATVPDFSSTVTQVDISSGSESVSFYYKTSSTDSYTILEVSYTINGYASAETMWVSVMTGGISNARVHKGDYGLAKSVAMSAEETAYIDFDSGSSNASWQVMVSTSPDRSNPLWTYWGWGASVPGQIGWNGYLSYYDPQTLTTRYEKAPSGTYYVRIQLGSSGGIVDDTLSVTMQSFEISGRITDGSASGVAGVSVSAYGPSYSYTISDADGRYRLAGLKTGAYNVTFFKDGAETTLPAVNAGESDRDVILRKPAMLKLSATRSVSAAAPSPEAWAGVNIYARDASNSYYGSLHFDVAVSTSDNGLWTSTSTPRYEIDNSTEAAYQGGRWTFITVVPGTYTVRAELYGYGSVVKEDVYVASGELREISDLRFQLKKTVYGTIALSEPAADDWGTWISVEAVPQGSSYATAWGWTSIPCGLSTGTYSIFGLDTGIYTLRAHATGYRKGSSSVTLAEGVEAVEASTMTLTTGGGLTGAVTVEGDTSDPSLGLGGGEQYTLSLNAWSPDSYSYGWTQLNLSTSSTLASSTFTLRGLDDGTYWINAWLNGFDLEGAAGGNGVRAAVSGGTGEVNLTFKRHSGRIRVKLTVPDSDYDNTRVYFQGGTFWNNDWYNGIALASAAYCGGAFDPGTGVLTTPRLGTGFYQVRAVYLPTGMEKNRSIMIVSGQMRDTDISLDAQTYTVSGRVGISQSNPPEGYSNSNFVALVATAPVVTINSSNPNTVWIDGQSTTSFRVSAIEYGKLSTVAGTAVAATATKSGIIDENGNYRITGLTPGVYMLKVPALELNGMHPDDGRETSPISERIVVTDSSITRNLEISKGYSVEGIVKLPAGETATRDFTINIFEANSFKVSNFAGGGDWSNYVGYATVNLYNSNSASYTVKGLSPGEYVIAVQDWGYSDPLMGWVPRQYANTSINVKVEGSSLYGRNIQLSTGGKIAFKLRDADSGTIITPQNRDKLLPQSFQVTTVANPWVEGGWASLSTVSGTSGDSFSLTFLPEASYDLALGQSSYGYATLTTLSGTAGGGNKTNYAAKSITGIKVKDGRTADLGIIDIRQGLSMSGIVRDSAGQGIPNIPVVAVPSLTNAWSSELRGFTDLNGKYSIPGLDPEIAYYDIIACPRVNPSLLGGYFFFGTGGVSYGEKTKPMVKVRETSAVDFVLAEARGSVKGRVTTEDGGLFQNPGDPNLPVARIYLQQEDTFSRTNPIGDIVADTELNGDFAVEALSAGTYRLVVMSGGYASLSRTVTVGTGEVNLGSLQLKLGARVSGDITKIDGRNPSTTEILSIVAASDDMTELLVGTLKISGEKSVTGYELNGLQPAVGYNIMFVTEGDDMLPAAVAYSVPFSSYVRTDFGLMYQPAPPAVFSRARREGASFVINFALTGALRKSLPEDDDLAGIIALTAGSGVLGDRYLAPDRKSLSCAYTPAAGESRFALRLRAFSKSVDPQTGTEFELNESFEYYAGVGARNRVRISNLRGGKLTLDGDATFVQFGPGVFEVRSSTSALTVEFSRAEDLAGLTAGSPAANGASRLSIPRPAAAYPVRSYAAMRLAQAAQVNPLSSFYDIMLPAGVSRTLKKTAALNIQYATGADPSLVNVYYYDDRNNVFLLEDANRTVDTAERMISITIRHASVFVVLESNAPVIQGSAYNGPLFVYNYPNPFNLADKNVTLANAPVAQQNQSTEGTMIHYGLPSGVSGEVELRIYTVTGELVRTLRDGTRDGGSHYYTAWDGRNDGGKRVASGVYIARFTVDGGQERFFKMAIIK